MHRKFIKIESIGNTLTNNKMNMNMQDYNCDFIGGHYGEAVKDGIRAVCAVGEDAWVQLKNRSDQPFMFEDSPLNDSIETHMKVIHSGASFAWTMRQLEYIAKNGWDDFVNSYKSKKQI